MVIVKDNLRRFGRALTLVLLAVHAATFASASPLETFPDLERSWPNTAFDIYGIDWDEVK